MSSTKAKKVRKYRGSKTHGGGSMKKRRGAGSRAGRGRAGSGKRGDQKKTRYWKEWSLGTHGFHSQTRDEYVALNVSDLEKQMSVLQSKNAVTKKGNSVVIDLTKAGVGKLLGSGQVKTNFKVTVDRASNSAIEKIKAAGGEVVLPNVESADVEEGE